MTMHAILIDDTQESRPLLWSETAKPAPKPGEVLIRAHASAVNRADLVQRSGKYPPPPGASSILGLEIAGVVAEVGDGVDEALIGKRVCALLSGGGYGAFATVDAALLLNLPDDMSFERAAAFPEVFTTAYVNLKMEGQVEQGQRAMIHAAASGVGTAALQLCREWGVEAWATASGPKLEACRSLGAHRVINRHEQSFLDVVRAHAPEGVDMILDPVGGSYLEDNLKALAKRGRLVLIGLMGGREASLPLGLVLVKRLQIKGSVLRSRSPQEKRDIMARIRQDIWPMYVEGRIDAVIHETIPIQQAQRAHELVASNQTTGKVILSFD